MAGQDKDDLSAFRAEVRAWPEENCPPGARGIPQSAANSFWGGRNPVHQSEDRKQWFERIELRPSEYWHRNCYATLGLSQLDYLGANRVMWASDYPHSEGCFGYSRRAIQSVIDAAGREAVGWIVGATAIALYGL